MRTLKNDWIIISIVILSINFILKFNQISQFYSLAFYNVEENQLITSGLYFTSVPSLRLKKFFTKNNFKNLIFILENNPVNQNKFTS